MSANLVAVVAGLLAHHGAFIRGEWHLRIKSIVVGHGVLTGLVLCILCTRSNTLANALQSLAVLSAWYLGSLYTSMSLYRLFFHPLCQFPGPRLAALTKFWHVYHARNSTNYLVMQKMHDKYGTFVRTGPNEMTIFHPGAIELIDGAKNTTTKDTFYDVLKPRTSAIFTRDEIDHKERRHAWNQSLSTKSMDTFRPRLAEKAQALQRCIASYGAQPISINDVMTWFSFDAMGDIVFGRDFGLMRDQSTLPAIRHQGRALALLGPIIDTMWIAQAAFAFVPWLGRVRDWMRMVDFCEEQMAGRVRRGGEGKLDMAAWFIDEFYGLEGSRSEKDRWLLLNGSAISAVVAGSDTTRAALIATWYYLCKHSEHMSIIQTEIENVDVDNANELALLPHLNAVINEVLRLLPPAMTGNGRITGPSGLLLDGTLIPPFTKITAPKYVIQRMDCAFQHPHCFIPERWYSRPHLIHDKRAFFPFSIGGRQCVGKVVAYAELRLATAILLKHHNVCFAPGYNPDVMWRDMKDQVTAQPGEVLCCFRPR